MEELGGKYTRLMAPAFVEGLGHPEQIAENDNFYERMVAAQSAVMAGLETVDWASSNLPDKVFGSPDAYVERPLSPHDYARRLTTFAFEDALLPFQLSEAYAREHNIDTPIAVLLKISRSNLIKVAKLADDDKSHLYAVIKQRTHPDPEMRAIADAFGDPKFEGEPVILSEGMAILDWHPMIRAWIEARLYPDRGCPASRFAVNINGKNTALINYFWDRLAETLYSDPAE